jgi:excinuclease UvrABC ATPase subunit
MDAINCLEEFKSLNEVTNKNESDQNQNLVENNINLVMDQNICNNCKRHIEKSNLKRVFGQKNVYECKGIESKKCEEVLNTEKRKIYNEKEEIRRKIQQEEKEKKKKLFNDEYLEYILENEDNFIKCELQFRDGNVRYLDPKKNIIFKKSLFGQKEWSIEDRYSKKY